MSRLEGHAQMMVIKLQQHFPLRVTDWLLGGIVTTWGLVCLYLPASSWDQPIYSGLRHLADQETWGLFAVIVGVARMVALFINGAVRRTPHIRGMGAFVTMFLWLQLSLAMFNAEISTIGVAIYPWLFIADIYNVYRASQDARDSDLRYQASQRGTIGDAASA
jgi:hypothetical protein